MSRSSCPPPQTVSQLTDDAGSGDPAYKKTAIIAVGRVTSRGARMMRNGIFYNYDTTQSAGGGGTL